MLNSLRGLPSNDIHEIIPGCLYMSDVFTAENMQVLDQHKITHIVTVSGGIKPRYPHLFEYLVLPIDDSPDQMLKKHFLPAIEFIDKAIEGNPNNKVLVHCAAGISRSGGIVCAYIMWKQKWTFDNAWKFGRSKRPKMYPNSGF